MDDNRQVEEIEEKKAEVYLTMDPAETTQAKRRSFQEYFHVQSKMQRENDSSTDTAQKPSPVISSNKDKVTDNQVVETRDGAGTDLRAALYNVVEAGIELKGIDILLETPFQSLAIDSISEGLSAEELEDNTFIDEETSLLLDKTGNMNAEKNDHAENDENRRSGENRDESELVESGQAAQNVGEQKKKVTKRKKSKTKDKIVKEKSDDQHKVIVQCGSKYHSCDPMPENPRDECCVIL